MSMASVNEQDGDKLGNPLPHDPHFRGPRSKRGCTDIIFLLLFVCFLSGWCFVGYYGFKNGNPDQYLTAKDSIGRKCGVDAEVLDKPYLFFFDLTACANPKTLLNGCPTQQVCLKECPSQAWSSLPYTSGAKAFNKAEVQASLICVHEQTRTSVSSVGILKDVVDSQQCADWYLPSRSLYSRCINLVGRPSQLDRPGLSVGLSSYQAMLSSWASNQDDSYSYSVVVGKVTDDLQKSWRSVLVVLVITVLVSLFYIILLRWIAGTMTWLSLIGLLALLISCAWFSYQRFDYLKKYGPDEVNSSMIQGQLEELLNKSWIFLTLTIILGVLALILLLLMVFLRARIQLAIALIKEGSKAVTSVISSLFFPIIPWCLQIVVLLWVIFIWMSLSTVGDSIYTAQFRQGADCTCTGTYKTFMAYSSSKESKTIGNQRANRVIQLASMFFKWPLFVSEACYKGLDLKANDACLPTLFNQLCHNSSGAQCVGASCHFVRTDSPTIVSYFHVYNAFGLFWAVWFVLGLSDMILAGTFAAWYWTLHKRDVPFFVMTASMFRAFRYHLGTVAFGSLIIAICSFIRACIEYCEKKFKASENSILRAFFCCLKCFFWCLEAFLRYINKNAYIMCAIHGRNFCTSAKDAFGLLMRNVLRVAVLDKVTDFLFFVGKLLITIGMAVGANFLIFNSNRLNLNYGSLVPIVVIAICSYIIASIFFGVYSMAVDTLFLCFLEDCERNDGSVEKPYFMSVNLMRILGKKNKRINK